MPLATPMPTAPWANQGGGGNVVTPWKPPKPVQQQAPTVSYGANGGINVSFVPPTAAQYSTPFSPVGDIAKRVGGAGVQAAQQVGGQSLAQQLAAQAQLALSDAGYNGARGDLLLRQTQAQAQRDAALGGLQADSATAQGRLAGDRYRTVDLGMQGVQADRNYLGSMNQAFQQETANLEQDIGAQRSFLARAFGIETAQLDAMLGFAGEDRDITNRALDAQTGFAGERRSLSDRSSQLSYDQNSRQARSDATARGAMTSQGFGDTRSELARQLGLAKEGSGLDYRSTMSGIGTSREQNDLGYRKTVSDVGTRRSGAELSRDKGNQGLDSAWADRGVAASRQNAGYTKGMADADRQAANLSSLANDFGLQETDLRNRLERGINAANLDYASTVAALEGALSSNDEQQKAAAVAIITSMAGA